MTQYVTVSTKIPKQLKEKMQLFKIKPDKIMRKALEDEAKRREMEENLRVVCHRLHLLELSVKAAFPPLRIQTLPPAPS